MTASEKRLVHPVFISGRQHSGNTVLSAILGRVPECLAQLDENAFFEYRALVDRVKTAQERAEKVFDLLRLEDERLREPTLDHLRWLARERPRVSALELYREGMSYGATRLGRRFWVQKATSYIFYGQEILASMPDARLIYLVRNPYDIAASKKRRHEQRERIWNTMVGWNKGLRIAQALAAEYPDRLRVVRYEDLTRRPEETVRSLMTWLGHSFHTEYLDVPHVNRSETRYSVTGVGNGLYQSRINYYRDNLSRAEIAGLDMLADVDLLERFYPGLPHRSHRHSPRAMAKGAALVLQGPLRYATQYLRRYGGRPSLLVARTARRLRSSRT